MRGARKGQSYLNIEGAYVQHDTYTISYLLDWRHKHTHPKESDQKRSLLRPVSDLSTSCGLRDLGGTGLEPATTTVCRALVDDHSLALDARFETAWTETPSPTRDVSHTILRTRECCCHEHTVSPSPSSRPPLLFVLRRERPPFFRHSPPHWMVRSRTTRRGLLIGRGRTLYLTKAEPA